MAEIADEGMGLQKIDLNDLLAVLRQAPHVAQPPKSEMHGAAAGPFECGDRMLSREREQALQDGSAETFGSLLRRRPGFVVLVLLGMGVAAALVLLPFILLRG